MLKLRIALIILFTTITACSSDPTEIEYETFPELDARELYDSALNSMKNGNYQSAITRLEALDL
ncbi:MAG: hypothetical protein DRQ47_02385, partial [Gammaproteobacteria bacterium]